jgi:hypothetical protein
MGGRMRSYDPFVDGRDVLGHVRLAHSSGLIPSDTFWE